MDIPSDLDASFLQFIFKFTSLVERLQVVISTQCLSSQDNVWEGGAAREADEKALNGVTIIYRMVKLRSIILCANETRHEGQLPRHDGLVSSYIEREGPWPFGSI
jgi:hypothetical protein